MSNNKFGIIDDIYNLVISFSHSTGIATSVIVLVFGCVMATVLFQLTKRVPFLRPWHCQQAGYILTMGYCMLFFPLILTGL